MTISMHSDRASLLEKLSRATHARSLADNQDRELVAARGFGANGKHGDALLDLHLTLEHGKLRAARIEAMQITRAAARRNGWSIDRTRLRQISDQALLSYLQPKCPVCLGRGRINVESDKPHQYHPKPCSKCAGSGERPIPDRISRQVRIVVGEMDRLRDKTVGRIAGAMGWKRK